MFLVIKEIKLNSKAILNFDLAENSDNNPNDNNNS